MKILWQITYIVMALAIVILAAWWTAEDYYCKQRTEKKLDDISQYCYNLRADYDTLVKQIKQQKIKKGK